jgi:toxin ParE1/3/4
MKIKFTVEALADLDGILAFVATNHPTVSTALDRQIRTVLGRISAWPESAREVLDRRGVRVVALMRYPYRIFYSVTNDSVVILHLYHSSRRVPRA